MTFAAPTSTYANIASKIRLVTGRPDTSQLTVAALNQYIQTFLVYDFPEVLRLFNMKETYTFTTEPNIDSYDFLRNKYVSVQPPFYLDGYRGFWSQSSSEFYNTWPKLEFQHQAGFGNGGSGPYTFTVPESPILRAQVRYDGSLDSSIIVCATDSAGVTETFIDNGLGTLVDASESLTPTTSPTSRGTVNYATAAFSNIQFTGLGIPASNAITITTVPYVAGRPTSCLFFDDKFVLRPVPDNCYKFSIEAWKNPIAMLEEASNPELNEWWQFIALGAALKVFEDQAELEEYAKFYPIFEKYKTLILRRTIVQQTNQRTSTIYSEQTNLGYNQGFFPGRL